MKLFRPILYALLYTPSLQFLNNVYYSVVLRGEEGRSVIHFRLSVTAGCLFERMPSFAFSHRRSQRCVTFCMYAYSICLWHDKVYVYIAINASLDGDIALFFLL